MGKVVCLVCADSDGFAGLLRGVDRYCAGYGTVFMGRSGRQVSEDSHWCRHALGADARCSCEGASELSQRSR